MIFTTEVFFPIAQNIIAALLYDIGKDRFNLKQKKAIENLFFESLSEATTNTIINKGTTRRVLKILQKNELGIAIENFRQTGQLLEEDYFERRFAEIVSKQNANIIAKNFTEIIIKKIAENRNLTNELLLRYLNAIQSAEVKAKVFNEKLEKSINSSFISKGLPKWRKDFVIPVHGLLNLEDQLSQKSLLVLTGIPGTGKSTLISAYIFAYLSQELKQQKVFYYKFHQGLTDYRTFFDNLVIFIQNLISANEKDKISQALPIYVLKSNAVFILDDLQYIQDDKLKGMIRQLCIILQDDENFSGKFILISRKRLEFIPLYHKFRFEFNGLSKYECHLLLNQKWKIKLPEGYENKVIQIVKGNPQFLDFFRVWWEGSDREHVEIEQFFKHMPTVDVELRNYLKDELYNSLEKLKPCLNKLLKAVSFFRKSESKEFIQSIYFILGGKDFQHYLDALVDDWGLITIENNSCYGIHDIVREYYYQRIDKNHIKKRMHKQAAILYHKNTNREMDNIISFVESAHHYLKADENEQAADILNQILPECIKCGFYWPQLVHILERIDVKKLKNNNLKMDIFINRGSLYLEMGYYAKAEEDFQQCLALQPSEELQSKLQNNLGRVSKNKCQWDQAIEFYKKALKIGEILGNFNDLGEIYNNLGLVYKEKGELDLAINYFYKSLELGEKEENYHGIALTYKNIGLFYYDKGELDKAMEYSEKAVMAYKKVNNLRGVSQVYSNLGFIFREMGDLDKALKLHEDSLRIEKEIGDIHGQAKSFHNMGIVFFIQEDEKKANELFQKSIKIKERVGDLQNLANTYGAIGVMYFQKKDYDEALMNHQKALKLSEKIGYVKGQSTAFMNIGMIYFEQQRWDLALKFFRKAFKSKRKIGNLKDLAGTYHYIGLTEFNNGDYQTSITILIETAIVYSKISNSVNQINQNLSFIKQKVGSKPFNLMMFESLKEVSQNGILWDEYSGMDISDVRMSIVEIWGINVERLEIEVLYSKGAVLTETSAYAKAILWFDQALEKDPNHTGSLNDKAHSLNQLGRYEEALIYADRLLKINPNDEDGLCTKAEILWNIDKYKYHEEAKRLFLKAIDANPQNNSVINFAQKMIEEIEKYQEHL